MKQTKEHKEALETIEKLEKNQKEKLKTISEKRELLLKENEKLEENLKDVSITYETLTKTKNKLEKNKAELETLAEYEKIAKTPIITAEEAKKLKKCVLLSYKKDYDNKVDNIKEMLTKVSIAFDELYNEPMNNEINRFLSLVYKYFPKDNISALEKHHLYIGKYEFMSKEYAEKAKNLTYLFDSYPMN